MQRKLTSALLTVLLAVPALAQTTHYSEDFEGNHGWTLYGLWAVDGSPSSVPGGPAFSGAASVNFNNGRDFSGQQRGSCASPAIAITHDGEHTLGFRCNYRTETTGLRYDQRTVLIKDGSQVVASHQLASTSSQAPGLRCGVMGTWHSHEIELPRMAAGANLTVELAFDSVDAWANNFEGWFIDDVTVSSNPPAVAVFDKARRATVDFRQYSVATTVLANGAVEILQSSPTARYAPVTGTATAAELAALETAIANGDLATVPNTIPDPNVYIVAPTGVRLNVESQNPRNRVNVGSTLGIYGQWDAQVRPVVDALGAIQERLLAGPTTGGDDHGDDSSSATYLETDPTLPPTPGAIDPAGDVDFFQVAEITPAFMPFPIPKRTYVIETAVSGNMDTVIELYASDGTTLLATNDDGGSGLASRVVHTDVWGAVLYAKVRHYSTSGTGDYEIWATSTPVNNVPGPGTDDHGDTPADATEITLGGAPTSGVIDSAGDVDYFHWMEAVIAIFPPPQATYVIETSVAGNMDTVLEVYAHDGVTLLASNDDAPGLGYASRVTWTGNAGSIGSVKVRHYSSTGTGSYTVTVKKQP